MALFKDLSCLLIFSTTAVFPQPGADSGPGSAIEVSDVVYSVETGKVSFSVLSLSPKPIVAFGLKVNCKYGDDSIASFTFTTDYVPTLALAGRTIAGVPPGHNIGELRSGTRVTSTFGVSSKGGRYPVEASISPSFVIFSDNTVIGEEGPTVARLFSTWATSREECAGFLDALREIRSASNILAEVQAKSAALQRAADAVRVFGPQTPNSQQDRCVLCVQFARELDGVARRLRLQQGSPQEMLSRYIEDVERDCAAYAARAERAGGGR